ncbi:outer membrane beta-barrel protein [Croceiramulus getboli]|nr:outer membrane beta-barrel protein [Flavobacteriaceae bacterium YJPT1-3]
MRLKTLLLTALLMLSVLPLDCYAQEAWNLSFSPALNFPISKVQDEPLRIGNGFEFGVDYQWSERIQPYVGVIWNRFDTDEDFDEPNIRYVQKGVAVGLRYHFALANGKAKICFLRGGMVLMDLRTRSEGGEFDINTSFNIGAQFGAGLSLPLAHQWALRPELRWTLINHQADAPFSSADLDFRHLSLAVGLRYSWQ